ncbi:Hypothetical predicted protein, partial [Paramuricea clavata]
IMFNTRNKSETSKKSGFFSNSCQLDFGPDFLNPFNWHEEAKGLIVKISPWHLSYSDEGLIIQLEGVFAETCRTPVKFCFDFAQCLKKVTLHAEIDFEFHLSLRMIVNPVYLGDFENDMEFVRKTGVEKIVVGNDSFCVKRDMEHISIILMSGALRQSCNGKQALERIILIFDHRFDFLFGVLTQLDQCHYSPQVTDADKKKTNKNYLTPYRNGIFK